VGAGPAGLATATVCAERGHEVHLFDKDSQIGGQFNMAKKIPGKEEFYETLRYFKNRIAEVGVNLHLDTQVDAKQLAEGGYDEVIMATGVVPRPLKLAGINHPKVLSYLQVLAHEVPVGNRVAIIGAGGIGFDVAEYLTHDHSQTPDLASFLTEWGVDHEIQSRGGLQKPVASFSPRQIYLLQRKTTGVGRGLGKTTGWIHREALRKKGVEMLGGVEYQGVDDEGLHIVQDGEPRCLEVDHVIVCAGQLSNTLLAEQLKALGVKVHIIGGAKLASELDAKRAIHEGSYLAAAL